MAEVGRLTEAHEDMLERMMVAQEQVRDLEKAESESDDDVCCSAALRVDMMQRTMSEMKEERRQLYERAEDAEAWVREVEQNAGHGWREMSDDLRAQLAALRGGMPKRNALKHAAERLLHDADSTPDLDATEILRTVQWLVKLANEGAAK